MAKLALQSPLPGVLVFTGSPLGVNVTVLVEGREAVVVDSTATVGQSGEIYRHLVGEVGARVIAVVNTHWHSDHCGGNAGLTSGGAMVIAHRRHFETISRERNMVSRRPARIDYGRLIRPGILMDRRLDLILGKRTLQLVHAPGHSPDMVIVWDPAKGVLVASDNLLAGNRPDERTIPYFYWGSPWRLIGSLEYIRSLSPRLLVPGHGVPLAGEYAQTALTYALGYINWVLERTAELPRDVPLKTEDEPPRSWIEAVPLSDYLTVSAPPDWVWRMHELNLLRIYLDLHSTQKDG